MKKIYVKPFTSTLKVECETIMAVSTWEVEDKPIIGPVGAPHRHSSFWSDNENTNNPDIWE